MDSVLYSLFSRVFMLQDSHKCPWSHPLRIHDSNHTHSSLQ